MTNGARRWPVGAARRGAHGGWARPRSGAVRAGGGDGKRWLRLWVSRLRSRDQTLDAAAAARSATGAHRGESQGGLL